MTALTAADAFVASPRPVAAPRVRPSSARLRLTARGRRALAIALTVPVLAIGAALAWTGGLAVSATATSETITAQHEVVMVYPGDTLWSIATEVAPGSDPREVIADITSLNRLQGAIQPGQQLAIPLEYSR